MRAFHVSPGAGTGQTVSGAAHPQSGFARHNTADGPRDPVRMADAFQIEMLTATKRYVQFPTDVLHVILSHPDLLEMDKLLWIALYMHSEHGSRTTLKSRQWLADKLGKSESTIVRSVRRLRALGFLDVSETYFTSQDGTVHQGYNLYRTTIPLVLASELLQNLPDRAKARTSARPALRPPHPPIAAPAPATEAWRALRAPTAGRFRGGQVRGPSVGNRAPARTGDAPAGGTGATQQPNTEIDSSQTLPTARVAPPSAAQASIRAAVSDGLGDVPWRFDAHRRYVRARLEAFGHPVQDAQRLSDQILWQIEQGYLADRPTRHAVNVLLKLVQEGRYQVPRGYQRGARP